MNVVMKIQSNLPSNIANELREKLKTKTICFPNVSLKQSAYCREVGRGVQPISSFAHSQHHDELSRLRRLCAVGACLWHVQRYITQRKYSTIPTHPLFLSVCRTTLWFSFVIVAMCAFIITILIHLTIKFNGKLTNEYCTWHSILQKKMLVSLEKMCI